ncbi:MAG: hypothetical protein WCU00_13165 [Candidatus Latescibacterota bacterium]
MSEFTKTLIVDGVGGGGGNYATIKEAVDYFITNSIGGVVIVEQGSYDFDGTGYKTTVSIPDNVTLIGKGDVILNITANIPVFRNSNYSSGTNERIEMSGFIIDINYSSGAYGSNVMGEQLHY